MAEKVRIALIGAGGMANKVHYPSLADFADVELVGLCDLDAAKLGTTAERFSISNRYTDYKIMLKEVEPDAVYVLMPPHLLFDIAMDVMEAGHDLFIEKPPAVTTFQADNLARAAERHNVISGIGFQRRYHPLIHKCWDEVTSRGSLNQLSVSFYKNSPHTDVYPYYRGSIDLLHCDAIHAVDSLRYYAGLSPVSSVKSVVRKLDGWYDISFTALVSFENGVVGALFANWRSGRRMFLFEFHSSNATSIAEIDSDGKVWADNDTDPVLEESVSDTAKSSEFHRVQGFYDQARAFVDAVKSRNQLHNNLQDGVESMRLADRIIAEANND